MAQYAIMEWEGYEYDHNPKSADWYWVIGIMAVTGVIASILFGNILLAALIIIATLVIALHGAKHPHLHRFRLVGDGLIIGEELHPYERMLSFSMLEDIEGELPPVISIKTDSWHSPHLVIPLAGIDADELYAHFLQNVDESEHKHGIVELVAAWLGF